MKKKGRIWLLKGLIYNEENERGSLQSKDNRSVNVLYTWIETTAL